MAPTPPSAPPSTAPSAPPKYISPNERAFSKKVGTLKGLLPFVRPYRKLVILALIALTLTAGVSLLLPLALRRVIDHFNDKQSILDAYFLIAIAMAGIFALGAAYRYYLVTSLGEKVVSDIRRAVFSRVIGLSPSFYEKTLTGEVISRITTDTTLILSLVGSSVSIALRNILMFLGGLVLMFVTAPKLAILTLLIVPAVVLPIVIMGRRMRKLSRENQDWIAHSSAMASETLLAVQTVQAFSHEDETRKSFDELVKNSLNAAQKRIRARAIMTSIVIFLVFTGVVGILWLGTTAVKAHEMSIGTLIQFVIYAMIVAGSVGALSEIWGEVQRAAGATERLVELLKSNDPVLDPVHPKPLSHPIKGAISFEDVTFYYPTRPNHAAIKNLNLKIAPGEKVALVGPSGSGKTTLLQLLMRFYDPSHGDIKIDNKSLRDLSRSDFRRNIALVSQDPVIFAASTEENIRFGNSEASYKDIERAAKSAAAHEFITTLPGGYNSYLGERGVMLSGGQKQRIAIARAILRDAPILLLDEATSALDAESENLVQIAVESLSKGRTTLVIAHRLATVKKADRIIVLENGRIIAEGKHDELITQNGLYTRLAKLQLTQGTN